MIRFLFIAALTWLTTITPVLAAEAIGKITHIDGGGFRTTKTEKNELYLGTEIYLHDQVWSAHDSTVKITFIDQTELVLGSDSSVDIDEYIYDPNDSTKNKAHFNLTKSVFHYVSGQIAKKENPDVTLDLIFGSIGIRGTQIWRDMVMEDGQEQCRIYLEDGEAIVSNAQGQTTLAHGDGTRIKGFTAAPTPAKPWNEETIAEIKAKTKL